jgi:hypothetical protein
MARDKYHDLIRKLLEDEGWTITHDPFYVKTLITKVEIDLGAERIIAAEKDKEKIAVEIKSFLGHSTLHDFYKAIGQFALYLAALEETEPDRILFLAIPQTAYEYLFKDPLIEKVARTNSVRLIVYSVSKKDIVLWKK